MATTRQRKRSSSLSPNNFRNSLADGLAIWQASGVANGMTTRPLHMQSTPYLPPARQAPSVPHTPSMEETKKVGSSFSLLDLFRRSNKDHQTEDQNVDLPRPPKPTQAMQERLDALDVLFASAAGDTAKCRKQVLSRRSKLFESVDPVLLVLKLLPQELSNVHKCVKQALAWDFLTDLSKASFETDVNTIIKELSFSLQHLNITEKNESLHPEHSKKLAYNATEQHFEEWQHMASHETTETLKKALRQMYALGDNLQRAVEGVEMCLRNLTKTRIRYKRLLYEAMEVALARDEAQKKSGVTMDTLLHPAWN